MGDSSMTERERAVRLAKEAGMPTLTEFGYECVEQLIHLARAEAFEEAAKVCDSQAAEPECPERAAYCADAIRKLKENG